MVSVQPCPLAIVLCLITTLCWGTLANTQRLVGTDRQFQFLYWDYTIGILLSMLILSMTLGSMGSAGRRFFADISPAARNIWDMHLPGAQYST